MLLKNWKNYCQQIHNTSQTEIDIKYYEIRKDVEKLNLETIVTYDGNRQAYTPLVTNTLFSMKKFALKKTINAAPRLIDADDQMNQLKSIELYTQNTALTATIERRNQLIDTTFILSYSCFFPNQYVYSELLE
jgi:hypothetical protein